MSMSGSHRTVICAVDGSERAKDATRVGAYLAALIGADPLFVRAPDDPEDPATVLRDLAEGLDADALVIASRGRGSWRSALFGSLTRELVHDLPCPLVVVPPRSARLLLDPSGDGVPVVVCGSDGSTAAASAGRCAAGIADVLGARLLVVRPARDGATEELRDVGDAVRLTAERVRANLVVVPAGARGPGGPWWQRVASRPVVVVPRRPGGQLARPR